MKKIRYVEIFCILALILAVGIFVPSYISDAQEEKLLDQTVVEETSTVRITRTEKMEEKSALEKFAFLLNEDVEYIEYISISGGKRMDYTTAVETLYREMEALYSYGVLTESVGDVMDGRLYTAANTQNPSQSLVVWQFLVLDPYGKAYLATVDDATGKIIGLHMATGLPWPGYTDAAIGYEDLAYVWGSYLGMSMMDMNNISYADISVQGILDKMGEQNKMALELYGITDEIVENYYKKIADAAASEEKELRAKSTRIPEDETESYINDMQVVQGIKGIEMNITYYTENGREIPCVLEWNFSGFYFSAAGENEEAESEESGDENGSDAPGATGSSVGEESPDRNVMIENYDGETDAGQGEIYRYGGSETTDGAW